jgi:hypothetical protein
LRYLSQDATQDPIRVYTAIYTTMITLLLLVEREIGDRRISQIRKLIEEVTSKILKEKNSNRIDYQLHSNDKEINENALVTIPYRNIYNLPYQRNLFFIDKGNSLDELCAALDKSNEIRAIVGSCGMGKTQVALEYAYTRLNKYNIIWWIRCSNHSLLENDYNKLIELLNLPIKGLRDSTAITDAIRFWLDLNSNWLLIFDDVQNIEDIIGYIPTKLNGKIIITSQNQYIQTNAKLHHVKIFNRTEAVNYLIKQVNGLDKNDATKLVIMIGRHPLSLELAGSCLNATGISINEYLDSIEKLKINVFKFNNPSICTKALMFIVEISLKSIRNENPASMNIINLISFFSSEKISQSILSQGLKELAERSYSIPIAIGDEKELDSALKTLERYSLIDIFKGEIRIQKLIQYAVRGSVPALL